MGYLPPVKMTCNLTTVKMDACKQHAITGKLEDYYFIFDLKLQPQDHTLL